MSRYHDPFTTDVSFEDVSEGYSTDYTESEEYTEEDSYVNPSAVPIEQITEKFTSRLMEAAENYNSALSALDRGSTRAIEPYMDTEDYEAAFLEDYITKTSHKGDAHSHSHPHPIHHSFKHMTPAEFEKMLRNRTGDFNIWLEQAIPHAISSHNAWYNKRHGKGKGKVEHKTRKTGKKVSEIKPASSRTANRARIN